MTVASGQGADARIHPLAAPGRIAPVALRALAALPAAGAAAVAGGPWAIPVGTPSVSLLLTVERAAEGGKVRQRVLWAFGEDMATLSEETGLGDATVDAGDLVSPLVGAPVTIEPTSDTAVTRTLVVSVAPGATAIKVEGWEVGTPDTPSSWGVTVTGGV